MVGFATLSPPYVSGAVKRKGNVIARVVNNVKSSTLQAFVNEAVKNTLLALSTPTQLKDFGRSSNVAL